MAQREFLGGVTNTVIHTETDGTMHIEERQDVEPILDFTHAARNHRFDATSVDGMLRHEAEIPFVVFQEECKKLGVVPSLGSKEADLVIEAILVDPKYAAFRAAPTTRDPHIIMRGLR
jgi:hypothetical protein